MSPTGIRGGIVAHSRILSLMLQSEPEQRADQQDGTRSRLNGRRRSSVEPCIHINIGPRYHFPARLSCETYHEEVQSGELDRASKSQDQTPEDLPSRASQSVQHDYSVQTLRKKQSRH
ncbi:unnamed protein product [Cercospora beticola]|nr:unnamed protein product [Cercospora beticola]